MAGTLSAFSRCVMKTLHTESGRHTPSFVPSEASSLADPVDATPLMKQLIHVRVAQLQRAHLCSKACCASAHQAPCMRCLRGCPPPTDASRDSHPRRAHPCQALQQHNVW